MGCGAGKSAAEQTKVEQLAAQPAAQPAVAGQPAAARPSSSSAAWDSWSAADPTGGQARRLSLRGFREGDDVEMLSHNHGGWIACKIKAVYLHPAIAEGTLVPPNTIRVEFYDGDRFILEHDISDFLRKLPTTARRAGLQLPSKSQRQSAQIGDVEVFTYCSGVSSRSEHKLSTAMLEVLPGQLVEVDFCNPDWLKDYRGQLRMAGIGDHEVSGIDKVDARRATQSRPPPTPQTLRPSPRPLQGENRQDLDETSEVDQADARQATQPRPPQVPQTLRRIACTHFGKSGSATTTLLTKGTEEVVTTRKPGELVRITRSPEKVTGDTGQLIIVHKNAQVAPRAALAWGGGEPHNGF